MRRFTAADFTVLEDGRPQSTELLSFERVGMDDAGSASGAAPVDLPLLTSSGNAALRASNLRLIVLFFDFSSLDAEHTARAIEAAQQFLDERSTPVDRVAVVSLTTRFRVEQDFTGDVAALHGALRRIRNFNRDQLPSSAGSTDEPGDADAGERLFTGDGRMLALRSLARALERVPERTSLVYFGSGMGRIDNQSQLRATINAAVRGNLHIYPVDVRGLQAVAPVGGADRPSVGGIAALSGQAVSAQMGALAASHDVEAVLARETGGRAYYDSNDFGGALAQIQRDVAEYYVLGYSSTNTMRDGRFRRFEVRLQRRGVQLEYRVRAEKGVLT